MVPLRTCAEAWLTTHSQGLEASGSEQEETDSGKGNGFI